MSVHDWKFHDFDMLLNQRIRFNKHDRFHTYAVVYRMTHLAPGSKCLLLPYQKDADEKAPWIRMTKNEGMNGSVRYERYENLDAAIDASIKWARRKDEEQARGRRR